MAPAHDANSPATLEGRRAWIISDGKAGHEAQCLGVAAALKVDAEVKRVSPQGLAKLAAPWAPVDPRERFAQPGSQFAPPWPALVMATGRTTIPYIRALKRRAGLQTFAVVLLDPRTRASICDLIWVPEHDRRRGPNVVTTLTSPHAYTRERLAQLRDTLPPDIAALPRPRVAVLLGGPNRDYGYKPDDVARLGGMLKRVTAGGAGLMITPSRRTPAHLMDAVLEATRDVPRVFWSGEGENPYPMYLAAADAFIITADSVNMTCEAAVTGRPIYVFTPSESAPKFDRFHAGLRAYGATRPIDSVTDLRDAWSYAPLESARDIADEIQRRWRARMTMVPGLMGDAAPHNRL